MSIHKIIICPSSGIVSARAILASMEDKTVKLIQQPLTPNSKSFFVYSHENSFRKKRVSNDYLMNLDNSIIFRWGSRSTKIPSRNRIIYNSANSIKRASLKGDFRQDLEDNNILTPQSVLPSDDFSSVNFPVIARPQKHAKGSDFVILGNMTRLADHMDSHKSWYYSEVVNKDSEYRVHCALGKIIAVLRKPKPEDENIIAWNLNPDSDGFHVLPWGELNSKTMFNVCKSALKAMDVAGLDTGGVDVICKGTTAFVLEINNTPSVCDYTAKRWAMLLDNKIFSSLDEKIPHIDFMDFKKGKSFVWKNFQLESNQNN